MRILEKIVVIILVYKRTGGGSFQFLSWLIIKTKKWWGISRCTEVGELFAFHAVSTRLKQPEMTVQETLV